jgi:hypothetical protein
MSGFMMPFMEVAEYIKRKLQVKGITPSQVDAVLDLIQSEEISGEAFLYFSTLSEYDHYPHEKVKRILVGTRRIIGSIVAELKSERGLI